MNQHMMSGLLGLVSMSTLAGCFLGGTHTGDTGGGPVIPSDPVQVECKCGCYQGGSGIPNPFFDQFYTLCESSTATAQSTCSAKCGAFESDPSFMGTVSCSTATITTSTTACEPGSTGQGLRSSGDPRSTDLMLDRMASTATVSVYGTQSVVAVGGSMEFVGGCETGTCPISFSSIALNVGGFSASHAGTSYTVTNVQVVNNGPIVGTSVNGAFTLPYAQVKVLINATVNGVAYVLEGYPSQDILGQYVPSTASFLLHADFSSGGTDLWVSFSLPAGSMSRAPVADAGAPQTVVISPLGTSTRVLLDGSGSSDLDGNLSTINWYEGTTLLGTGTTLSSTFSLGTHTVAAFAYDAAGKSSSATTTVTVTH